MLLRFAASLLILPALCASAGAQSETWRLKPGSKAGPGSEIKPTCVTHPDGRVECTTEVERPSTDTPARPEFNPFSN
jgi:hypothetical protein